MKFKLLFTLTIVVFAFAGCQMTQQASTPSDTFKGYLDSAKKQDIQNLKQYLSKGTIKILEDNAKADNKTLDEALKASIETIKDKPMPEFRNEKVEGENASLEVKNDITGTWEKLPFTKEDGRWKIAMDKYMEEITKIVQEGTKKMEESMPAKDLEDVKGDKPKDDDKKDDK